MAWIILFSLAVGVAVVFTILGEIVTRRRLRRFARRGCTGRLWRQAFPRADKREIRAFLDVVLAAFLISEKRRLTFAPGDRVMDLYRAVVPPVFSMGADALELETLALELQEKHGLELAADRWDDITLGQLFATTGRSASGT